eukprot:2061067-Pleurochrysis_carterae.AAC.1
MARKQTARGGYRYHSGRPSADELARRERVDARAPARATASTHTASTRAQMRAREQPTALDA